MWWAVAIGVGVGLKIIYDSVSEGEREARSNWQSASRNLNRSIDYHQQQINERLAAAKARCEYQQLVGLHYAAVNAGSEAYKAFADVDESLTAIQKMLVSANAQRTLLQAAFDEAKATRNKAVFQDTLAQLKLVNELRRNLFADRDLVKQQRDELRAKLRELNNRTHELKLTIRDKCGSQGRDWYQRLEQRKQQRLSFAG